MTYDQIYHPPAYCPVDGIVPALAISMGGAGVPPISFVGSRTNCPQCGRLIKVLPGRYHVEFDHLSFTIDPSISPDALRALMDLAKSVGENRISPIQAVAQAETIRPGLGRLFAGLSQESKVTIAAAIISVAGSLLAAKMGTNTTIVNVQAPPAIEDVAQPATYPDLPEYGPRPTPRYVPTEWLATTSLNRIPVPIPRPTNKRR